MILGYIKGQNLDIKQNIIVSNSINYLTAQFVFLSADWEGLVKVAHFAQGDYHYPIVLENDMISSNAGLNLSEGEWSVYLHGNDTDGALRITTEPQKITVKPAGYTGEPMSPLPPSETEQILALAAKSLSTAEKALQTAVDSLPYAQRAETAAASAKDSEGAAKLSETNSADSEKTALKAAQTAVQAMSDLLAMLGEAVPTLVDGKIPLSQIPATATQEIYVVSSENELTSLDAQRGDLAELTEDIDGERTITKVWQLLGSSSNRDDWVVWGTSYAVQAGSAAYSDSAGDSARINGKRMVAMTFDEFETAVKDPDTYYTVYEEA